MPNDSEELTSKKIIDESTNVALNHFCIVTLSRDAHYHLDDSANRVQVASLASHLLLILEHKPAALADLCKEFRRQAEARFTPEDIAVILG